MDHSTNRYLMARNADSASGFGPPVRRVASVCSELLLLAAIAGCSSDGFAQPPPRLIPGPGNASLELIRGAGTPLCEAYARSLAQSSSDRGTEELLAADLGPLRRGYSDEERRLANNVRDFVWKRDANPANYVPEWRGTVEQLAEAKEEFGSRFWTDKVAPFGYRVSAIDIDNDGAVDNVFSMPEAGGFPLLVLNENATDVDTEKTERILMHPSRRQAGWAEMRPAWPDEVRTVGRSVMPVVDAYLGAVYHRVGSFRGQVYIGFAWRVHPEYSIPDWQAQSTSHLYEVAGEQLVERCEIRVHY